MVSLLLILRASSLRRNFLVFGWMDRWIFGAKRLAGNKILEKGCRTRIMCVSTTPALNKHNSNCSQSFKVSKAHSLKIV